MEQKAKNSSSLRLRYYIALSAPPTRAPLEGPVPFMRPEVGFNPSWFHERCGIDFSERWHQDPDHRLQTIEIMRKEVRRRFPGRNIGGSEEMDQPLDLLTGTYGASVKGGLFGQHIRYFTDKWPAVHDTPLDDEAADRLEPVDVENNEFFEDIFRQIDRIEELTGTVRGYLNWQGVLNSAFRLRGQQIFMDMVLEPNRARHVFECVALTIIRGTKLLYDRQRQAGVDIRFASVGNCTVNMAGPKHYVEHLLPFDQMIRREFEAFGIHNCAWTVDPYMEAYATVPKLGYIDMGLDSDLEKARRLFPEARRNILYTSMDLLNKSEAALRADFEKIARELAPCDVGLPDIEADVPDERILLAMDLCEELSQKYAGQATVTGGA